MEVFVEDLVEDELVHDPKDLVALPNPIEPNRIHPLLHQPPQTFSPLPSAPDTS
jgi:hypothetical protein